MNRRLPLLVIVGIVVVAGIVVAPKVSSYIRRSRIEAEQKSAAIPPPEPPPVSSSTSSSSFSSSLSSSSYSSLRASVNWGVPFTSQAPTGNWDALHGEACEEASVLMAIRYFQEKPIASVVEAEEAIQHLVAANTALGYPVDDTAAEVAKLIQSEDPMLDVSVLKNPTVDQIKEILSSGKLVIVPAQGQFLGNPYYKAPGPRYHMLLLRGYTDDGYVITNDPGTKRGEQYVYSWDVMMNAIHDWNGGDVENGQKVVVVVSK